MIPAKNHISSDFLPEFNKGAAAGPKSNNFFDGFVLFLCMPFVILT